VINVPFIGGLTLYIRFMLALAGGLAAFCFAAAGILDSFFTEFSWRDYKRAAQAARLDGLLAGDEMSFADFAAQVASGRLSSKREQEIHKEIASRSYRSYSQVA
jgi:hypothetical protein